MAINVDSLRQAVGEKYGVYFRPSYLFGWSAFGEFVLEPLNAAENHEIGKWFYSALHEIGYIKTRCIEYQDTYSSVKIESMAWRWACSELREFGLEIPSYFIRE